MNLAVTDLSSIGTALAMLVIAFMQFWNQHKSVKRDVVVSEIKKLTEATAIKVEEVHQLTNGGMGDQLQIAMVAATTLANVTNRPEHEALAEIAKKKYEAHMLSLSLALETTNKATTVTK